MVKPISAVHFAHAVTNVLKEALNNNSNTQLFFPVFDPTAMADWLSDSWAEGPPAESKIVTFRFEWWHNWQADRWEWSIKGSPGAIHGVVTGEVMLNASKETILVALTRDIVNAARDQKWITDGKSDLYYENKKKAFAKIYGTQTGSFESSKPSQNWSNSGEKLKQVIPGMSFKIPEAICPAAPACGINPRARDWTFRDLVIHLNDGHRWPRSDKDKPPQDRPNWDMSINIADWSEQYALRHDLDMNFRTPEEMEEIAKKKIQEKKIQGHKAAFHIEDELESPFQESVLHKLLEHYGLGKEAGKLLTPKDHPFKKIGDPLDFIGQEATVNVVKEYDGGSPGPLEFSEEFLFTKSSDSKSLKELSKEWLKKYDDFNKGKWNDIISSGEA